MPRTEVFDRQLVLDRAKDVFWQKGYNGTSMQDLVDATGLNRSSIYNSFGNKRALYNAALEKYKDETDTFFEACDCTTLTGLQVVQSIFSNVIESIESDTENKGCMVMNCATELSGKDRKLDKWLRGSLDETTDKIEEYVLKGQKDGSIRKDESSRALADYLVAGLHGLRITSLSNKDKEMLKGIANKIVTSIQ